jgi:hypothetical protein
MISGTVLTLPAGPTILYAPLAFCHHWYEDCYAALSVIYALSLKWQAYLMQPAIGYPQTLCASACSMRPKNAKHFTHLYNQGGLYPYTLAMIYNTWTVEVSQVV